MTHITRLLVANRSEIAIRAFRCAHELGIRTIAMYSQEDRYALHRFKADEADQIGQAGEPLRSDLNIEEVIDLAKKYKIDAIHPGYGSSGALLRWCERFVNPAPEPGRLDFVNGEENQWLSL